MKRDLIKIFFGVLIVGVICFAGYFFLIGYLMQKNADQRKNRPYQAQEAQMLREMAEGKSETQAEGLPPELKAEINQHMADVKNQNDSWGHIERGDRFTKEGDHNNAFDEYKKAYELTPSNKTMAGNLAILALRRATRYSEALELLEEMKTFTFKKEVGIAQYNQIRAELLESIKKQRSEHF